MDRSPAAAVEMLFDGPDWQTEAGCAVAVIEKGTTVWSRCFGLAHLASRAPISSATRFRVASITKPMFAVAVAALVKQGHVSLDDPLSRHIPEASFGDATLGQLLSMKSGVLETYPLAWMALGGGVLHTFDARNLLALLLAQDSRNHPPGERTIYANANYLLAQLALERIVGKPCGAVLRELVFEPAGMPDTVMADGPAHQLRGAALAYEKGPKGFAIADPVGVTGASGAVVSTLNDMAQFYQWLRTDPYGWRDQLARRLTHNDGSPSNYAHGFQLQNVGAFATIGHSGGLNGWACDSIWAPEPDLAVVILGNRNDINWYERSREIMLVWLNQPGDPACTPRLLRPVPPPPIWAADFACESEGFSVRLEGAPGELLVEGRRIIAADDGIFRRSLGVEAVAFELDGLPDLPPQLVTRTEGNFRTLLEPAGLRPGPDPAALTGSFGRLNMPASVQVAIDANGLLRLHVGPRWPAGDRWELRPVIGNLFRAFDLAGKPTEVHVRFEMYDQGRAQSLHLAMSRVLSYELTRVTDQPDITWPERVEQAPSFLDWRPE